MRWSGCFSVVSTACWLAFASQGSLVVGQQGPDNSSIRLVSGTEPVRDDPAAELTAPAAAPVVEESPSRLAVVEQEDQAPAAASTRAEQEEETALEEDSATAMPAQSAPQPMIRPRLPIAYYAGGSPRAASTQPPGPAPVQSAPRFQQNRRGGKPFQSASSQPTLSPYLYLTGTPTNASQIPNYFAFVRPQLDQVEANRQQQREIQQLRTQLQKISNGGGGGQQPAGMQSAARYMDTAQFYGGLHR